MPGYRTKSDKYIYNPKSKEPWRISRTKIELFMNCPRCFYLDQRLGIPRTSFPAFTLNSAVDQLLKEEFDTHRKKKSAHPLMEEYGIDAVPYQHEMMEEWRKNFNGVRTLHRETNFIVFGAVDDIWENKNGELHVVDYKATSKNEEPDLEGFWQQAFKRQMEIYQWLLRMNKDKTGKDVSDTGYFVYANGKKDAEAFDGKLEFDVIIIPYKGDDSWVSGVLVEAKKTLDSDEIPEVGEHCEYCPYREAAGRKLLELSRKKAGKEKSKTKEDEGEKKTGALF